MKLIFMGTPDFTLPILDALDRAGHEIELVETQPDAPVGRKQVLTPPPAKKWAAEHNIPVFQPERIREPEAVEQLRQYEAEVFVVAAFGQILPKEILDMPKYGCINIHASLLPKYRGAAPIQWAILNGDKTTGVTIMQMGEGLDDGDILLQKEIAIESDDTGGSLFDKLAELGGEAIVEALDALEKGTLSATPQDEALATNVGKIDKSLGKLDFSKSAEELERYVRGLFPWPGTYCTFREKNLKILSAEVVSGQKIAQSGNILPDKKTAQLGKTVVVTENAWIVNTGNGYLSLLKVQPAGKKAMAVADFLRGNRVEVGELVE